MASSRAASLPLLLVLPVLLQGQSLGPRHNVWLLDTGPSQVMPAPVLHVLDPGGAPIGTAAVPGSSQARGIGFDQDAFCYVCRGDLVHQLDPAGNATGVTLSPPSGASKAQDVVQLADGTMLVAWGATAGSSALARYDRTTGAMVEVLADPGLDHPRRLAPIDDTTVVVANRGAPNLLLLDLSTAPPGFSVLADLAPENVGPIGLAFDPTRGAVWVVSDHGQNPVIGFVELASGTFVTVMDYANDPTAPAGFFAPAGCWFDRFRTLYVAGRNSVTPAGTGAPGAYVFAADTGAALFLLEVFPSSGPLPASLVDLALQPVVMETCAPVDMATAEPVLVDGASNQIQLTAPAASGAVYAAALSAQWPVSCAPLVPGILELAFPGSDPRGVPFVNDFLFRGTAAVPFPGACGLCLPSDPPLPLLGVGVTGFVGTLDAAGQALASVDLAIGVPAIDGAVLTLAWVTIDSGTASGIGFISDPLCVTLRAGPLAVSGCAGL